MTLSKLFLKILVVVFLTGCATTKSYDSSDYFTVHEQNQIRYQINTNSQNEALLKASNELSPKQRESTFKIVHEVLNTNGLDLKSLSDAELLLGLLYRKKDPFTSFNYLKSSADKNNALALYVLAQYYRFTSNNLNIPRDDVMRFNYTKRSAENHQPDAQYQLAHLYLTGVGVRKNYILYVHWLDQSCKRNNKHACNQYYDIVNSANNARLNW